MTVAYELIRSKRRTIALVIDSEGKCRVRAPLQARLSDLDRTFCAGKDRVDRAETAALCRSAEEAAADIDRWDAVVCIG